jgi:hypothetical protein
MKIEQVVVITPEEAEEFCGVVNCRVYCNCSVGCPINDNKSFNVIVVDKDMKQTKITKNGNMKISASEVSSTFCDNINCEGINCSACPVDKEKFKVRIKEE